MTTTTDQAVEMRGRELVDRDGDRIGKIEEIYLDNETGKIEWAAVKTGLFGGRQTFVPLREATATDELVRVPYEKTHVKQAPNVEPTGQLSQQEEEQLYAHFGLEYSKQRSSSGLPEGGVAGRSADEAGSPQSAATPEAGDGDEETSRRAGGGDGFGDEADQRVERADERPAGGSLRLRKYVVTEHVTQTVPVQREEVRLERDEGGAPPAS